MASRVTVADLGQGEALHLQLQDLAVNLVQVRRLGSDLHLQLGRGLVHQVNGLQQRTKVLPSCTVLPMLHAARQTNRTAQA